MTNNGTYPIKNRLEILQKTENKYKKWQCTHIHKITLRMHVIFSTLFKIHIHSFSTVEYLCTVYTLADLGYGNPGSDL